MYIYIHTHWSWWFKQSDWFTISDFSIVFTSYRVDNVWARCFFPFFLQNDKVEKILGLTFFRQEKTEKDSKRRFSICYCWVFCSMDCLQFPFIRVEQAISWTQGFLTRKIWPKNRSLFMKNKFVANGCRNSTYQVNTKNNATGRRRLTSSNQAAIFVSTSCEERHNKPFGYKLGEPTENNKALLFFSRKETIQTFNGSI